MSEEIVKVCKVHGELTEGGVYFYKRINRDKIQMSCKMCCKEIQRKRKEILNAQARERNKKYGTYKKGYEKRMNIIRDDPEMYNNFRKKQNNYNRISTKKYRDKLSDWYIKNIICRTHKIKREIISNEFVEVYRANLELKRKLKEIKNVNK